MNTEYINKLRAQFRGSIIEANQDDYDDRRKLWNARIDRRPAVIARCMSASDVVQAVIFGRKHGLMLGVSSGGHSVFEQAACNGGLLIDLSMMKGIRVCPEKYTARVEPGVLLGEFDRETQAFGLSTPTGVTASVGLSGLTLGGGIGRLGRKYGLTCDNLLSVDIVTAEGKLLTADKNQFSDLFWAIRGGGGNFGIITSFEYRLHSVGPNVLGGNVVYPLSQARQILSFYDEFSRHAADEISADLILATLPNGEPVVGLSLCYIGSIEEGKKALEPLRRAGQPLFDDIAEISYVDIQSSGADLFPKGLHYYWTSQFMNRIGSDGIEILLSHFSRVPSARSVVLFQLFGGAVSRLATDAAAFYHRKALHDCIMISIWDDAEDSHRQIKWAREIGEAMKPYVSTGFYLNNFCGESPSQIRESYGKNWERLTQIKKLYDPENIFQANPNILPEN